MEITSGNAVLAAEAHGSGDPPILLLHAGVTDQRSWRHVIDALPDHLCLTYDARGYGRTTYETEEGWSSVDDAVAVLAAYGVGRAVVVASSMGGMTALDLALAHPELVAALVLVAPAISGAPDPTYEAAVLAMDDEAEAAEARRDLAALNALEARLWLDGPSVPEGRVAGPARELFLDMNGLAQLAADPGARGEGQGAWDRLTEISVPTLLLVGEHDLRYLREYAVHASRTIPRARLVELPGVAHLPHLENDERTLNEIADFVATVGSDGC
jgi:pimeloyl-ACP methyl ester carboxylesterase